MVRSAGVVSDGLLLRVSVPLSGELAVVGQETAIKLGEQLGLEGAAAARLGETLSELAAAMDTASGAEVAYEFHKQEHELRIEARQGGRVAERRVPLGS